MSETVVDMPEEDLQVAVFVLVVLLAALVLGFAGFAVHTLWMVAAALFFFWLLGFGLDWGHAKGPRRWYRW
jgi:hypothetical protein